MAETTYRISAGLINVEATGETVYYICAGLPNGWLQFVLVETLYFGVSG